ncbi:MAG: hypothetical protein KC561_21295, partial [Myxococcales bacterium]|nr:hypothetical protein [Myxococcales bacterium]
MIRPMLASPARAWLHAAVLLHAAVILGCGEDTTQPTPQGQDADQQFDSTTDLATDASETDNLSLDASDSIGIDSSSAPDGVDVLD